MRLLLCNLRDARHPAAGGAEVFTHQLMKRWAASGHEVTQFSAAIESQPGTTSVDGVQIVRGGTGRLGVFRAARRWYEEGSHGQFDVIVDEVNTRPFFCHEWAGDTPTVALIHQVAREVWFSEFSWPVASVGRWWLEPRWLARYKYVPTLTISESSARSLRGYGLQRVIVAPVGVEPPPNIGKIARETQPTIVFVGRLVPNKQPDHAIEAFAAVAQQIPDAQLWVVGSGPMTEQLRKSAPPNVTLFGHVDNRRKYELLARAHVLVATSVREGWGLVVDEAASVGTPTIGYDVDGLRDSIAQARGLLVQPNPRSLATATINHLQNATATLAALPDTRRAMGWDGAARRILSLITEMAELSTRPPAKVLLAPTPASPVEA